MIYYGLCYFSEYRLILLCFWKLVVIFIIFVIFESYGVEGIVLFCKFLYISFVVWNKIKIGIKYFLWVYNWSFYLVY